MTFEEILDQAMAMLQRRRRVTYSTLRLQFRLDDEQLAALKDELCTRNLTWSMTRGAAWFGPATRTRPQTSRHLLGHLCRLKANKA